MIRNLRVLFYADLTRPFVPPDLDTRPLGGSETALVRVTRGLAARGWSVVVAAHPEDRMGSYDNVAYVNVSGGAWRNPEPDIVVVFRQLPHVLRRLPGRVCILWAHDHIGIYPELPRGIRRAMLAAGWKLAYPVFGARAPVIVAVSEWLRRCFVSYARWPDHTVHAIRNGIDPTYFPLTPLAAHGDVPRVAYTSVPERGLSLLIERIMPAVWRAIPGVELHVFSYQPLERYRSLQDGSPGPVILRGGLRQPELARELTQFDLWLYPTDFPETSCIAAMEAQAAGVPVVTSRRFALTETVEDRHTGVLIDGTVGSDGYVQQFAMAAIDLLKDQQKRARMGSRARERVLAEFTWDNVIDLWDGLLRRLAQPPTTAGERPWP